MFARVTVCLIVITLPSLSTAQNYTRGPYECGNFKEIESTYLSDSENVHYRMYYGECLILKGDDATGIGHLQAAAALDQVKANFLLAEYVETGGTYVRDGVDPDSINEAIALYSDAMDEMVHPDYPYYPDDANLIYERNRQMELRTYYRIPMLYAEKFGRGFLGTENMYTGAGNTYFDYAPFTEDSLIQMKRTAQECLDLSQKGYRSEYHDFALYTQIVAGNEEVVPTCQTLRDVAGVLLPLEEKWRAVLSDASCTGDLLNCSEYVAIKEDIIAKANEASQNIRKTFETEISPAR